MELLVTLANLVADRLSDRDGSDFTWAFLQPSVLLNYLLVFIR